MQGAFKPLLKWGKHTVIGECVEQMRNSRLADIFVVLGHREAEIRPRLPGTGVQYAINKDFQRGMLTSVKAGLAMLSRNADAFLLALVDQPMITSEIIDKLIDAYDYGDNGIILPVYEGNYGHPVIIATSYVDEIMQLDDNLEGGLREFVRAHRDDWLEVPFDTPAVIEDIDSPEDYQRLSKQVELLYEYHKWHP